MLSPVHLTFVCQLSNTESVGVKQGSYFWWPLGACSCLPGCGPNGNSTPRLSHSAFVSLYWQAPLFPRPWHFLRLALSTVSSAYTPLSCLHNLFLSGWLFTLSSLNKLANPPPTPLPLFSHESYSDAQRSLGGCSESFLRTQWKESEDDHLFFNQQCEGYLNCMQSKRFGVYSRV